MKISLWYILNNKWNISIFLRQNFLWGMLYTFIFIPNRDPITDQNIDSTKVQLTEPMSFVLFFFSGLLTEAEMIQRKLHHQSLPIAVS